VSQLARFFSQLVIQVLGNLLLLVGILMALYLQDWRIGLAFTIFGGIALWILTRLRNFATLQLKAERQASAELFGFLEERLRGTEDLRANGATAYTMRRLFGTMRTLWARSQAATRRTAPFGSIIVIWFETGTALALVLGALLFQRNMISLGMVFLLYSYIRMLMTPLMLLTQELQHLQEASASLLRIGELYNTQRTIVDGVGAPLPAGALTVEFRQVSFHYGAFRTEATEDANTKMENEIGAALHEISFCLAPGRTLGLLGRTGSGKSTIARLLLRLYDPQHGAISLGDVDVRTLRLSDLHNRVAIVTQEVQLFQATLRDNLTLFNQRISDARIWAVLDEIGLAAWGRALPQGLDTMLSSGEGGLSAGEAQLLAFARVFLSQPSVVILDEASSRLDPATEQRIDRAIERLLHPAESPRTGIVIAHRLATVQCVDDILILDNGRIVEFGPRQVLAENSDTHFARLLRTGLDSF
jgi:ATP-binding cassette subfamily B protein